MSVLVAVRGANGTGIGCDGRITNGDTITTDAAVKWLRIRPDLFVGIAGQWRATDLVAAEIALCRDIPWLSGRYPIDEPNDPDGRARLVAHEIRALCRVDGFIDEAKDGCARFLDVSMLIAQPDALHRVDTAGSVSRVETHHAIGSGAQFALGALDALALIRPESQTGRPPDPVSPARAAVEAAIRRCSTCGGEVFLHEVRR